MNRTNMPTGLVIVTVFLGLLALPTAASVFEDDWDPFADAQQEANVNIQQWSDIFADSGWANAEQESNTDVQQDVDMFAEGWMSDTGARQEANLNVRADAQVTSIHGEAAVRQESSTNVGQNANVKVAGHAFMDKTVPKTETVKKQKPVTKQPIQERPRKKRPEKVKKEQPKKEKPEKKPEKKRYWQIDLAGGEPIHDLGERTYHSENRMIRFAHGNTEAYEVRRSGSPHQVSCVTDSDSFTVHSQQRTVTAGFTVADRDGCENTKVTFASYVKDHRDWQPELAGEQQLFDHETRTVGPGHHIITISLP